MYGCGYNSRGLNRINGGHERPISEEVKMLRHFKLVDIISLYVDCLSLVYYDGCKPSLINLNKGQFETVVKFMCGMYGGLSILVHKVPYMKNTICSADYDMKLRESRVTVENDTLLINTRFELYNVKSFISFKEVKHVI